MKGEFVKSQSGLFVLADASILAHYETEEEIAELLR